jgi:hypothetical protein
VHSREGQTGAVGSTYSMERELPTGRAENDLGVFARDRPREFGIRTTSGPTPFNYRYRFEPAPEGTVVRLDALTKNRGVLGMSFGHRGAGQDGRAVTSSAYPIDEFSAASVGREFVLRADFDLLDSDGCSWISLRFLRGPTPPRAGDLVYLIDFEGRGCVGTVERIEGWYACVRPDWATWTGGDLPLGARTSGRRLLLD